MEAITVAKYETKNYKIRKFPYFQNKTLIFSKNRALQHFTENEDFLPSEILYCNWMKWNQPDEIVFRAGSGNIYLVSNDDLLKEISDFARRECCRSRDQIEPLSYIHIEGKESFECYEKPEKSLIIKFLKNHLADYDISTPEGKIVKKALTNVRKYISC